MQKKVLFAAYLAFVGISLSAQAWNSNYIELHPGKLLQTTQSNVKEAMIDQSIVSLRIVVPSKNAFEQPMVAIGRRGDRQRPSCQFDRNILLTSDFSENKRVWFQAWEIRIRLLPAASLGESCLITVSHSQFEPAYVSIYKDTLATVVPQKRSKNSKKSENNSGSFGENDRLDGSGRNSSCPAYDCEDEPRRRTSPGGPDDVTDEPSRGDGAFDGGGYSRNDGL